MPTASGIFHCRVRRIKTSVHVDHDCEEDEGSIGESRLRFRIGTGGDLNIIKLVVVGERDVRNTSLLKTYTTDHFFDYFLNKDGYGYTAPVKIAKEAPFEQLVWGMENIKVGVVGDRGVGKTCLYITNSINRFPSADFFRIAKPGWDYATQVKVAEEIYTLHPWETAGQEDNESDRLRFHHYYSTDIFLVCFSVCDPASFRNAEEKWVPKIKRHCRNIPFLLVGTQVDLRYDGAVVDELAKNKETPVSKEAGEMLAKGLNAARYMECSALTGEGVKNVFNEATMQFIECEKKRIKKAKSIKRGCVVL